MRTKITQICFTYTDSCCFSRKDKFLLKNRYAEAKRENAPAYRNYGKLKKSVRNSSSGPIHRVDEERQLEEEERAYRHRQYPQKNQGDFYPR